MTNFCHLHVHGQHSQLDGIGTAEQYAGEAKHLGQTHLALTDHGNIDGILKHQKACAKQGITPMLGCEMYVCQDMAVKDNQRYHICAYIRSDEGLVNLMRMLSLANLEGFYKRPRVDPKTLLDHVGGLAFSTACVGSFINMPDGERLLLQLAEAAPIWLEIMPHKHPKQVEHNLKCLGLSKRYGIPLVATNDCHYPFPGMEETQEVLLAMQRKARWSDKDRWHMRDWPGLHLRSADEMDLAFREQSCLEPSVWQDAMYRTMEVAELCGGYTVGRVPVELPKVHGHEDRDETELMWEVISDGWNERILTDSRDVPGQPGLKTATWKPDYAIYESRINEEFDLICQQGFQRYFLIVWELINWCQGRGIMTGPGRGSVGGSLVAYLMGITDVDPIKYGLIFARFISPERIDYPDIDMDFEDSRREEVRQHLRDCYGEHNVAGLSTFLTMKGKAALRNVARVFEVPLKEVDLAAKSIISLPDGHDRSAHTIEDGLKNSPPLSEFQKKYPQVVKHAMALEGQIYSSGQHAAATCLAMGDLRDGRHCNLVRRSDTLVANWEMTDAEHMGLMKLDVLGLSALSILNGAKRMVKELYGVDIEFDRLPLDDPGVYQEIAAGNTAGAFQIGSALNTRYCQELGVREFHDIVLINALTRPGPLGSGVTDQFIRRRRGQEPITYIHPRMETYTRDTLGLVVFQEQVMWAMYELAGLSWGECDKVRKVMGKSKGATAFLEFRQKFVDGCLAQKTLSAREAEHVWDQLATFGAYGFNKCISGDTKVIRASCNQFQPQEVSIRELWQAQNSNTPWGQKLRYKGIKILQMDDDGRVRPGRLKKVYYNGIKPVYKIKTVFGREILCTENHRLLTQDGYRQVSDLSTSDYLVGICEEVKSTSNGHSVQAENNRGKTYEGCGFPKGEQNPAWINGKTSLFESAKAEVTERSKEICESCGTVEQGRFEFAHLKTLEQCNGDYSKYHSKNNIKYLCNSCHKKLDYQNGTRKKQWSKGRPTRPEKIISIELFGKSDTYDLEMDTPGHNFIANNLVSHNSHALAYSLIGWWTMWMKVHYPAEFLAACLTWGGQDESRAYVDEARRLGIGVELPADGKSLANRWLPESIAQGVFPADSKMVLWPPLTAIKGVGESQATKILTGKFKDKPATQKKKEAKPALRGFFDKEITAPVQQEVQPVQQKPGGKIAELLETVGYYRDKPLTYDQLKAASPHFDFNVMTGAERFATLGKSLAGHSDRELEGCNLRDNINLIRIGRYILPPIKCQACELINECTRPVQPSFGRYRLMIVGEAPGRDEDQQGIGFVGDTGNNILWPEMAKYGLTPFMFHVTNVVKCWPQRTKTPTKRHIAACSPHLEAEIEGLRPVMILAFGNTNLQFFRGEGGGITKMVEQRPVEWSDKYQCWICWSIHPSAVLHSAGNRSLFEQGIETFAKKLAVVGGHSWAAGVAHMGDNWKIEYPGSCPYGGDFGFDNNKYGVCQDCPEWERCAKATAVTSDWHGLPGLG